MTGLRIPSRSGPTALPAGTRGTIAALFGVLAAIGAWRQRARQRRSLRNLDERMLRDIGLTPHDVRQEAAKAPWQA